MERFSKYLFQALRKFALKLLFYRFNLINQPIYKFLLAIKSIDNWKDSVILRQIYIIFLFSQSEMTLLTSNQPNCTLQIQQNALFSKLRPILKYFPKGKHLQLADIKHKNIKSQTLRICHKANKLYINFTYTAISRELRLLKFCHFSILPRKNSSWKIYRHFNYYQYSKKVFAWDLIFYSLI